MAEITYTEREELLEEKRRLQMYLINTDYKAIKFFEGVMSEEEFAPVRTARQTARDRINEIEGLLFPNGP